MSSFSLILTFFNLLQKLQEELLTNPGAHPFDEVCILLLFLFIWSRCFCFFLFFFAKNMLVCKQSFHELKSNGHSEPGSTYLMHICIISCIIM